ncbi:hypothetical protein TWF718_007789 [Orbilia javanica]|uniref:Nephrocystin 3-like N-terminal domain-containing protein n=1 Tax=Orbilia javanica TaxID=47235 RepID=A0AAN8RCL9_9PEZI
MEAVGAAASIIAIIDLTAKLAKLCKGYIGDVKNAESDQLALYDRILATEKLVKEVDILIKGPDKGKLESSADLEDALARCRKILKELEEKLKPKSTKTRFKRFVRILKWPLNKGEIDRVVGNLKELEGAIQLAIKLDELKIVLSVDKKVDKIVAAVTRIAGLPIAEGAVFGSYEDQHEPKCLPNTREQLLKDFEAWTTAARDDAKPIFWLSGAAGTGKSTICRTVATLLRDKGMLAASFFFKRGGGDRGNASKFVTTIAAGLSAYYSDLSPHIENAVNEDPGISTKNLNDQFESLVLAPIASGLGAAANNKAVSIIVIDALDECDNENDIRLLVKLLGKLADQAAVDIRVFITSRPETPIYAGFKKIDGTYKDLVLHNIEEKIIQHDIQIFFEQEFKNIADEFDGMLPKGWPEKGIIQRLVQMSSPLFIVASTICRLVSGSRSTLGPKRQLEKILDYQSKSHISKVGRIYAPVLDQLLLGRDEEEKALIIQTTVDMLGILFITKTPMSRRDISQLLEVEEDVILCRLRELRSVLHVPEDPTESIRPYHLSFQEFLLDPKSESITLFYVDVGKIRGKLAGWCISLLDKKLKRNMCRLEPDQAFEEIDRDEREAIVRKYIPSAVRYACQFWVGNAIHDRRIHVDNGQMHRFLERHLLHWLELSAVIDPSVINNVLLPEITRLYRNISVKTSPILSAVLSEISQFIIGNQKVFERWPLQIYSRAIIGTPDNSKIRQLFVKDSSYFTGTSRSTKKWDSQRHQIYLPVLYGEWFKDGLDIQCIDFSFYGDHLLCISNSGILWVFSLENLNGAPLEFEVGVGKFVFAALFDIRDIGNFIAVGTDDGEIRIFDLASNKTIEILTAGGNPKCSGATSTRIMNNSTWGWKYSEYHARPPPSSSIRPILHLASASNSAHSINIWIVPENQKYTAAELHRVLNCPSAFFTFICFDKDCKFLASASADVLIRVWDVETGYLTAVVERDSGPAPAPCSGLCCHENQVKSIISHRPEEFAIVVGGKIENWNFSEPSSPTVAYPPENSDETLGLGSWSFGRRSFLSAGADGGIRVWDCDGNDITRRISYMDHNTRKITSVRASEHRGGMAASLSCSGRVDIWNLNISAAIIPEQVYPRMWERHHVYFSPDGDLLATVVERDYQIRLWSVMSHESPRFLRAEEFIIAHLVIFSADSKLLGCVLVDNTVNIWRTLTGDLTYSWRMESSPVRGLAFSPDAEAIAVYAGKPSATLELWDLNPIPPIKAVTVATGLRCGGTNLIEKSQYHMAFSKDRRHLAWVDVRGWDDHVSSAFKQNSSVEENFYSLSVYIWDILTQEIKHRRFSFKSNPFLHFSPQSFGYQDSFFRSKVVCPNGVLDIEKWAKADGDDQPPQLEPGLPYFQQDYSGLWLSWNGRRRLMMTGDDGVQVAAMDQHDHRFAWLTRTGDVGFLELDEASMSRFEEWHRNEG